MPRHQCLTCRTHQRVPAAPTEGDALCLQCGSPLRAVTHPEQLIGLRAAGASAGAREHPEQDEDPQRAFLARRRRQLDRERTRRAPLTEPSGDDPADAIAVAIALPRAGV